MYIYLPHYSLDGRDDFWICYLEKHKWEINCDKRIELKSIYIKLFPMVLSPGMAHFISLIFYALGLGLWFWVKVGTVDVYGLELGFMVGN